MSRTAVYNAIVLRNRPSGESNSEVTLLTAEEGLIRATVFGGAKSKLRSHCSPFNSGKVWLYRSKAKEYAKLCDFDVEFWRAGLRENYDRTMTSCALADTIMSTHGGGGGWEAVLKMIIETLDTVETADEELCGRLMVHFLWKWSQFLGIQPNVDTCSECGKAVRNVPMFLNVQDCSVLCARCKPVILDSAFDVPHSTFLSPNSSFLIPHSKLLQLNPGCRKWLSAVDPLEAAQVSRYSMDNKSFNEAKSLVTSVLSGAMGKRLASWNW